MSSIKFLLKNLPEAKNADAEGDPMHNPEYLRKSSKLISESLQGGLDVLQLQNGDIVTTGTKIIVTKYRWDEAEQKMVKISAKEEAKLEKQAAEGQGDEEYASKSKARAKKNLEPVGEAE